MNNKRANNAVSEIIGTMLLLLIAISALSVIYFQVLSDDGPTPNTIVKIVGREEGKYIILEHQGGETIGYDTKITYTIAGYTDSSTIWELKEVDKEPLGVWNLGERLKIPILYVLEYLDEFQTAEITGIDIASNSIVFSGPIDLPQPTSDVGVGITIYYVNGTPANAGDDLLINITITSYGGDVNGSGGVTVYYKMPEGLDYVSSFSPSGHDDEPYDPETYNWNWTAGNILVGSPAKLQINAKINGTMGRRPTQLAMVLDGSGSIMDYEEWTNDTSQKHNGSYSTQSSQVTESKYYEGYFRCNSLNASGASSITVDFWYRLDDTESSDLRLYYFDAGSNVWDSIASIGGGSEDTWLHYTNTFSDSKYFNPNFRIGFRSFLLGGENVWIDDVLITTNLDTLLDDGFEGNPWDANWKSDWDMMRIGLANSIRNESVFPQDGSVELTVVQFGYSYAVVEVPPTNVTNGAIANNTADYVLNINQRYGNTPFAAGIYLSTDQLSTSENFSSYDRQAIVLVTDGLPNMCSDRPFGNRPNGPYDSYGGWGCNAEESAETARDDLRSKFNMSNESDTIDEIDSLAVGNAPDVDWLNSSIVWPNPYIWDITSTDSYSDPGWVATINSFEQFESAIKEMFIALFSIQNTVNFVSSTTYDPNDDNNYATVTIQG